LRGGSWGSRGRGARCANRDGHEPDHRDQYIGFRFAPGQDGPAEPAGRVLKKSLAEPATLRPGPAEPGSAARLAGQPSGTDGGLASRGGTPPTLTERIKRWFKDR
jgi:hypothetical protein